jgi:hypothetical protein
MFASFALISKATSWMALITHLLVVALSLAHHFRGVWNACFYGARFEGDNFGYYLVGFAFLWLLNNFSDTETKSAPGFSTSSDRKGETQKTSQPRVSRSTKEGTKGKIRAHQKED